MGRFFLRFTAGLTGLGLAGLVGVASAQPGGNPGSAAGRGVSTTTQTAAPSPGQVGPPGGNIGSGSASNQGLSQGTPGGAPVTSGVGPGGGNFQPGATTAGTAGSYGRFVTQPFNGGTPSMFGNTPGMFGSTGTTTNGGMQPTPLGGEPRAFGNAPVGTPLGDFQAGGVNAPYGTPGANGVYAGNTSGVATYPGTLGGAYGNFGSGYANNDTGYRGYSPYYGNNNGNGLTAQGSAFQQSNNTTNGYGGLAYNTPYNGALYGTVPYGMNTYAAGGPGVEYLGYPNAATPGSYPPWNPAGASTAYAPQAYNYGIGAVPSWPGVGNMGYPNAASSGSYPQAAPVFTPSAYYGWF